MAAVADSLTAEPVYELILFTRHPDGLWKMMDAMSRAGSTGVSGWSTSRAEANAGQGEIRGLDWDDNEKAWVDEIASNIEGLLAQDGGFVIASKLGDVLGRTLGLARETHIKQALDVLFARGVIRDVPKGNKQRAYIARA